jgi:hypothetical protein
MLLTSTCSCGRVLTVNPEATNARIHCPTCAQAIVVRPPGSQASSDLPPPGAVGGIPVSEACLPATSISQVGPAPTAPGTARGPWLLAGAAILLIGLGIGVALNLIKQSDASGKDSTSEKKSDDRSLKESDPLDPPHDAISLDSIPSAKVEPPLELPSLLGPIEKEPTPSPTPTPSPSPIPETGPKPPPTGSKPEEKSKRPTLKVVKVTPEEPKLGAPLSIDLKSSHPEGKPVKLQFRLNPRADWQPVPGERLHFPTVMVPLVFLEMRAIDEMGNTSAVERRNWTIPIPAGQLQNVQALPALPAVGTLQLRWGLKPGDSFLQELIVSQNPTFNVLGIVIQSPMSYSVVSRFLVEDMGPRGYTVAQRIEGARLLHADNLTSGMILPALSRMPGTIFRMHLDHGMNVVHFAGGNPQMLFAARNLPGGMGLQTASLMDLDGWREMAQATFFQPPGPLTANRTYWIKPMTHNWGPLGAWVGQTLYMYSGSKGPLHQFSYGHRMNHVPARGQIGAAFHALEAAGTILFDGSRGRVVGGEERFRVAGRINMNVLGQNAGIDIQETQTFQFRIIDVAR